jgi:plastocyanin
MKKLFGFCILVILLVTISGCTQQAQPAKVTPAPTTVETTIATMEPTPVATPIATTIATPVATPTAEAVATVATTVPVVTNVTSELPGLVSTPKVSLTPQTKITTISMTNNTFTPNELTVLPGTGITWRNDDTVNHAVKGTTETGSTMFNSGDIIPATTWSYTFGDRLGTFTIVDPGYPQMKCTIIVKEGQNFSGTL